MKVYTDPKWLGKNWKMISSIAGLLMFIFGWIVAVNATVDGLPKLEKRVGTIETALVDETKANAAYRAQFNTFLEMYKLEVLGNRKAAQEIARGLTPNNP